MMRCGYAKCINATAAAAALATAAATAKSSLLLLQLLADASIIRHVDLARHNDDADDGVADNATVCVVLPLSLPLLFLFPSPSLIICAALCDHPNAIKNQSMAHKTNEKCNKIRFELIAGLGVSFILFSSFLFIAPISY